MAKFEYLLPSYAHTTRHQHYLQQQQIQSGSGREPYYAPHLGQVGYKRLAVDMVAFWTPRRKVLCH